MAASEVNIKIEAPGIPVALGIAFVVLKLTHTITWSWLWVTAPFWGPLALVLVGLVLFLLISTLTE